MGLWTMYDHICLSLVHIIIFAPYSIIYVSGFVLPPFQKGWVAPGTALLMGCNLSPPILALVVDVVVDALQKVLQRPLVFFKGLPSFTIY